MSDLGSATCPKPSVERLWAELAPKLPSRPPGGKTLTEICEEWQMGRTAAERELALLIQAGRMERVQGVETIGIQRRRVGFYVPKLSPQ
jgi:hypothetical protein